MSIGYAYRCAVCGLGIYGGELHYKLVVDGVVREYHRQCLPMPKESEEG